MATTMKTATGCSHVLPDDGEVIRIFDEAIVVKVSGAETGQTYAVLVGSVAPGGGPPLHAHPGSETFYVLSGEFAVTQRDERGVSTFRTGPGTVVNAPGGALHRFENVSPTRSTMLMVVAAETVDFLRELGAAFPPGAQPDMEKMLAIDAKYGIETVYGEDGARPEPPAAGMMSDRARALAWRFRHANEQLIATIAGCTSEQWRAVCADTGWTVGVQAHHIAMGEAAFAGAVREALVGHAHPPLTTAQLDDLNAQHAAAFAHVTIAETVALLRDNGGQAAATFRGLSEAQLGQPIMLMEGETIRLVDVIEQYSIGEIERHGSYIQAALECGGADPAA